MEYGDVTFDHDPRMPLCGEDCLEYHPEGPTIGHWTYYIRNATVRAATYGHLDCLRYAHQNGCPWDDAVCVGAAKNNQLECLRYAHEHGCPWDERTCNEASGNGHLELLRYAHQNGCPWNAWTPAFAAGGGHLDCLRYAHENGCPWDETTTTSASQAGQLECLRYALENECPHSTATCFVATSRGRLECLRYAHQHGVPWDEKTCSEASQNGHLDCLRYAHEHGCPWDRETCTRASENGHLDCLRYAHQNGAPWDEWTCGYASQNGHADCLRYALDNHCPSRLTLTRVHPDCLPVWYHMSAPRARFPLKYHSAIREHRSQHVRSALKKLRLVVILLRWYNETCHARYAPDGVGYREAEADFRKLKSEPSATLQGDCAPQEDDGTEELLDGTHQEGGDGIDLDGRRSGTIVWCPRQVPRVPSAGPTMLRHPLL